MKQFSSCTKMFLFATLLAALFALVSCKSEEAKAADALIGQIGEVTLESGDAIEAAEEAVEDLTAEDRDKLDRLSTLEEARETYDRLVIEDAAAKIERKIEKIGEVTLESADAIAAVEKAYHDAPQEVQELVSNADKIDDAKEALTELERQKDLQNKAAAIEKKIDAIGEITANSEPAIEAAQSSYDSAPEEVREYVTNYDKLEQARERFTELQEQEQRDEAAAIEEKINAIGEVTLESAQAIDSARKSYNGAGTEVQAFVTNLPVLEAAEASLDNLLAARAEELKARMWIHEDKVAGLRFYHTSVIPHSDTGFYNDERCFVLPYFIEDIATGELTMNWIFNYTGRDWVFFDQVILSVDGSNTTITFDYFEVDREAVMGGVKENTQPEATASDITLLRSIASSTETIVRFQGDSDRYDLTVSAKDKQGITDVLDLYELMGGK